MKIKISEQQKIYDKLRKAIENTMKDYKPHNIDISVSFRTIDPGKKFTITFETLK